MRKLLSIFVVIVFSFVSNIRVNGQAPVIPGEVPHTYDVSPNGSFNYTIPLRIPPGIKDMVPNLAINYNSNGGNGMLGVGWSISGLSVITRGLPTLYHNGDIQPVDLNSDDVYFLDGQRLLGIGNSTYLTEVKNFAVIQSHGTTGNGPAYFTVEYPNGTRYEYGYAPGTFANTEMLAEGKYTALMWPLSRVTDAHGNRMYFEYDATTASAGEYRITKITYGVNANSSLNTNPNYIKFNYQSTVRQDENEVYINGSEVLSRYLLDYIEVLFSDQSQANKYQFTYDTDMLTRLIKIEELRDGQEVLSPITINWGTSQGWATVDPSYSTTAFSKDAVLSGDYNGDGYSDIVTVKLAGSSTDLNIYMNCSGTPSCSTTMNIPIQVTPNGNIIQNSNTQARRTVDYNGDGMDDLILMEHLGNSGSGTGGQTKEYKIWLLLANGTSSVFNSPILLQNKQNSDPDNDNFLEFIHVTNGDYDGDGKSELITFIPFSFQNSNNVIEYEVFVVGEEYGGSHKIHHINVAHISSLYTLDFNGDGKDEFMFTHIDNNVLSATTWGLWLSSYSSNFNPVLNQGPGQWPVWGYGTHAFPNKNDKCWFGDFNGDGKSDVMAWDATSGWSIAYSDGVEPAYSNPGHWPTVVSNTSHTLSGLSLYGPGQAQNGGLYGWYPADFNGDGYCDFLQLIINTAHTTVDYKLFYSTGKNFYQTYGTLSVTDANALMMALGDFNGNGQIDIFSNWYTQAQLIKFRENDNSLKVTSIEHIGKTLEIDYTTLAQDADYVKIATGNGYFKNRTLPIKVVKNLSDNISLDNTYTYKGLMYHSCGLGLRGFKNFSIENNIGQKTYQEYDLISNQHPFITRTQVFDAWSGMPFGKETVYQYIDIDGGANGKSRIVMSAPSITTDYINSAITENNIVTGATNSGTVFYDFGKIASTEVYQTDLNSAGTYGSQITTFDYGVNWAANNGKPISIITYSEKDPGGLNGITTTVDYTYNTYGDIATETSEPGSATNEKVTTYTYGSDYGNLEKIEITATNIANALVTEYSYTNDGKFMTSESELVDPSMGLNYITTYDYGDPQQLQATWGNLLKTTGIKGIWTEYVYDRLNRITKTTNSAQGFITNTEYDWAVNSQYSTTNPHEQFVVTTTNEQGANKPYNDVKSVTITDKYGREIRKINTGPGGNEIVDMAYTSDGKLLSSTMPYLPLTPVITTTYSYDDYGRVTAEQTDNGGKTILTSYALSGGLLQTTVTNLVANGRSRTYETCGDYLKRIFNSTLTEELTYTYHGNGTKAITYSNGMKFENFLDNYGRLIEVRQPNAGSKFYTYDALDRIDIETLTNGTQYQYTYDNLGRVLTKQEVGSGTNPYTYEYGNVMNMADAGEIKLEEAPNGNKTEYEYQNGLLQKVKEYNGLQNFISGNDPFSTTYYYNPDGTVQQITYPWEMSILYDYNSWGGVSKVSLSSMQLPGNPNSPWKMWEGWGYNSLGQLQGGYFYDNAGNQLYNVGYNYDLFGLPVKEWVHNNNFLSGPFIKEMTYSFDVHTGNLNNRHDIITNNKEVFDYDSYYDRLMKIDLNSGMQIVDMDYDGNNNVANFPGCLPNGSLGNISDKTDVAQPQLHIPTNKKGWKYEGYALDVIPDPSAVSIIPQFKQEVDYYNFQKIRWIEEELNNRVDFEYGANNQRVKAEYSDITGGAANPVLQQTKYYAKNFEYIIDPNNGDRHNVFVWAGGKLIAVVQSQTNPGTISPNSATLYYAATDYLGSITHLMDDNGNGGALGVGLIEERSFDAWGRVRDPQTWNTYPTGPGGFPGNWITDRGYTGQEHIWLGMYDNNVINLNGRLYDPLVGRMFSPDPYIPDGTNSQDYNKYIYARNNPLKYTDKNGNFVFTAVAAGVVYGAIIGAGVAGVSYSAQAGNSWNWSGFGKAAAYGAVGGAIGGGIGGAFAGSAFAQSVGFGVLKSTASQVGASVIMGDEINAGTFIGGVAGGLVGGTLPQFSGISGLGGGSFVNATAELGYSALRGAVTGAVSGSIATGLNGGDIREGALSGAKYGALGGLGQSAFMISTFGSAYKPLRSYQNAYSEKLGDIQGRFSPVFRRGGIYGTLFNRAVTWGRNHVLPTGTRHHTVHEYGHYMQAIRQGFGLMQLRGAYEQIRYELSGHRWNPYSIQGTNEYQVTYNDWTY